MLLAFALFGTLGYRERLLVSLLGYPSPCPNSSSRLSQPKKTMQRWAGATEQKRRFVIRTTCRMTSGPWLSSAAMWMILLNGGEGADRRRSAAKLQPAPSLNRREVCVQQMQRTALSLCGRENAPRRVKLCAHISSHIFFLFCFVRVGFSVIIPLGPTMKGVMNELMNVADRWETLPPPAEYFLRTLIFSFFGSRRFFFFLLHFARMPSIGLQARQHHHHQLYGAPRSAFPS